MRALLLHVPMQTALATALIGACTLAVGCDPTLDLRCEPGPWRSETWSTSPRVEAKLRDGCSFPDDETEYQIWTYSRVVLDGELEDFNARHAIRGLEGGGVEISIWDRSCVVTEVSVECRDIDDRGW
jgi:hypothetical protein